MEKLYPDELNLTERLPSGRRYIIPIGFMRGRQRADEYSQEKMKRAIASIRKGGIDYLKNNPIILCYMKTLRGGYFGIVDGHHRVRAATNRRMTGERIPRIPSLVYTPKEIVPTFEDILHKRFDEVTLAQRFDEQIAEALASFNFLDDKKIPRSTIGPIHDIDSLPFQTF
jgi:hypothetical protein